MLSWPIGDIYPDAMLTQPTDFPIRASPQRQDLLLDAKSTKGFGSQASVAGSSGRNYSGPGPRHGRCRRSKRPEAIRREVVGVISDDAPNSSSFSPLAPLARAAIADSQPPNRCCGCSTGGDLGQERSWLTGKVNRRRVCSSLSGFPSGLCQSNRPA